MTRPGTLAPADAAALAALTAACPHLPSCAATSAPSPTS